MTTALLVDMTIEELVARFVEIGIAQDKAERIDDRRRFKRLYRQMDEIDNELRARGPAARRALLALFDHPNLQVRLKAAKRSLAVAPQEARQTIEAIVQTAQLPQAGEAGMMLSLLDRGLFVPT